MTAASTVDRVRALLLVHDLDAVVLRRRSSFAWLTGGGSSAVDLGSELGVATVVIGRDRAWLVTSRIEADRLVEEEVGDADLELVTTAWDDADPLPLEVLRDGRVGADVAAAGWVDLGAALREERMRLDDRALDRYRALGRDAAAAVEEACAALEPGRTERALAAEVAHGALRRGIQPAVLLVGADDRRLRHRHPLPTLNPVRGEVMVVLCGERHGLYANLTRFVRLGPPDAGATGRHAVVARVLDAALAATVPGQTYGEVFAAITAAYAEAGLPEEWTRHHQGGPTGYATRELVATARTAERVAVGHAVTWNPSVAGAKCEDTVLLTPDGPEIVTTTGAWPRTLPDGSRTGLPLPAVLER